MGFFEYVGLIFPSLLSGAFVSVKIFLFTLLFSLPLGIPISLMSMSKIPPVRWIADIYIWIFRGTPLMLQLFFVYFSIPILLPEININIFGLAMVIPLTLSSLHAAILTFSLNYAAYFAEIYRGGIQSIDRGQREAAQSLGLSKGKTMRLIVFPQATRRIIPPAFNEVITLVKDTALVNVIGITELLKAAKDANNRDVNPTGYLIAAMIYLVVTFVLTIIAKEIEKHYRRYDANSTI